MSTELENVKKQEEEYSASNIQVLEGLEEYTEIFRIKQERCGIGFG